MGNCPKCGAEIDEQAAFCEECGAKLARASEPGGASPPSPDAADQATRTHARAGGGEAAASTEPPGHSSVSTVSGSPVNSCA